MKLPEYFCSLENVDYFEWEKCTQFWAAVNFAVAPEPGIISFAGKWYVWPPEYFDRKDSNHILLWLAFQKPYKTRHAAAIACMMLYPE